MTSKIIVEILLFSLLPLGTMIIGGVAGTVFNIKPQLRSVVLHLAAGVIFAVVAVELLPDIVERHNILGISVGFFAGLLLMLGIKHFSHAADKPHAEDSNINLSAAIPKALIIGIGIDIFIDGILLGVGFAAGHSEGILLCIALSLEILVLGLVVSTELKNKKILPKSILITVVLIGLTFVVGAFFGSLMLSMLNENVLSYILAFGLSALLYLVTEELLVEAHELKDTPLNTAVFFIGFFVFLIIAILY